MAKDKVTPVETSDDGWFTSEWGELRPPATEIDNTVPQAQSETVVTENKVVIPEVAQPAGEK